MEISPFTIKRMTLDSARLRVRTESIDSKKKGDDFPAYWVVSTAPHNIDQCDRIPAQSLEKAQEGLRAIAQDLHDIQIDETIPEPPELVIVVHGYNTLEEGVQSWYSDLYRHIAQDDVHIRHRKNIVFIGYRWSSERVTLGLKPVWGHFRALPNWPQNLLLVGLAFMLSYWGWTAVAEPLWKNQWADFIGATALSSAVALSMVILTLLLLRMTVYFRDVYRAMHFGVPDLTELVRQIDQAVVDLRVADLRREHGDYIDALRHAKRIGRGELLEEINDAPDKIKLNFLGHSMGGLVITHTVRILSDVFDRRSIARNPVSDIGYTLRLGRLILASPDIPVLSIISSRANGLASSLRRFQEAYLFSNEGDLALRLASTAANYISFPSAKQSHGHRLGSVALTSQTDRKGIINLQALREYYAPERSLGDALMQDPNDILHSLYITHSSGKGDGYLSLGELFDMESGPGTYGSLADVFTFFDCTDYHDFKLLLDKNGRRDRTPTETGLLTRAKNKPHLNWGDYLQLGFDGLMGKRDVHGGYFQGEYSRQLIYRLAFLGFEGLLKAMAAEDGAAANPQEALVVLDDRCANKGIQVYLSPLRYRVDVQGADLLASKESLFHVIVKGAPAAAS